MNFPLIFAATSEPNGGLIEALGIDWRLLIVQIIAFLILVWVLGKFVYPWLMKSVDERQQDVEAAALAAEKAQEAAANSHKETAKLLAKARKEATEIVETAKLEATDMLSKSEARARNSAEQIVSDAQAQIDKDVDRARRELHDETLQLIGLATKKVVQATHSQSADEALIVKALKESK